MGNTIDRARTISERNVSDDVATQPGKGTPKTKQPKDVLQGPHERKEYGSETLQRTGADEFRTLMLAGTETAEGHASGPTPEQKARAEWEAKKTAFDAAEKTNKSADARIAELEQQKAHLNVLYQSGQIGEGVLTWKELEFLKANGSDAEKAAATWMIQNKSDFWDTMLKSSTALDLNGVPNLNGEPVGRGLTREGFQAKIRELDAYSAQTRATKVTLPADPGPAPGTPTAVTNASTGTGSTPSTPTPKASGASMTPNFDGVGPIKQTGRTGEENLLGGIDHLQAQMEALEKDMVAAASDPAKMQRINQMYSKLQTAQSMLMQLLKQRTEMMNNIQKMYSEMAMSAVRNMR
jgi:hypothetical protein